MFVSGAIEDLPGWTIGLSIMLPLD